MLLSLARKTKKSLLIILQVFERGFGRKSPISTGGNGRLKPGSLLNLSEHIGNETRKFSNVIALIFTEQQFFKRALSLLTHQVIIIVYVGGEIFNWTWKIYEKCIMELN